MLRKGDTNSDFSFVFLNAIHQLNAFGIDDVLCLNEHGSQRFPLVAARVFGEEISKAASDFRRFHQAFCVFRRQKSPVIRFVADFF